MLISPQLDISDLEESDADMPLDLLAAVESSQYWEGSGPPPPLPPPSRPAKMRVGGFHPQVWAGEVGPCTRCGWVWYPDQRTLTKSEWPTRCSNCRSVDWRVEPKMPGAARPGDAKWLTRRSGIIERKRDRHMKRLKELAYEIGVKVVDARATSVPASVPGVPPRPTHAIPPPPGMGESE